MALPDRIRLVVLFGGRSAEHEVSCTTAAHVLRAIDHTRYEALPVGITKQGEWLRSDEALAALADGAAALPGSLEAVGTAIEPMPTMHPAASDAVTVVLPLLHGPFGEDGTVQGMLELADVPYVGAGVLGSALAMDKGKAKEVAANAGIPQGAFRCVRDVHLDDDVLAEIVGALGYPLFVKPANMGSSVGVTKVHGEGELQGAIDAAVGYDEWVLFEEMIEGRELECAVLGSARPRASVVGEVRPSAEFYDYEDKYSGDGAKLDIPANVPTEVSDELRRLACEAFTAVRADGMARVDFFYEEAGRGLLLNEVNTIPGFTPFSMYPKLWEASGIPYAKLIDELVALALERHERRSRLRTDR